jgi:sec-independent protein translocase protein TatA
LCDNSYVKLSASRKCDVSEEKSMGDFLQPWHLIVLAVVAFLLFGAKRLPEMGKGLGEGLKGFKEGLKGINDPAPPTQQSSPVPPPVAPPSTPVEPK